MIAIPSSVRRAAALAAIVACAAPPGLGAQETAPSSLSLSEAVDLAVRNNPGFLATRNDADAAEWEVRSAYGALLPSFDASADVSWQGSGEQRFGGLTTRELGFADQPSYYFSSYNVGLSYTVNGSTLTAPARARANRDATEARIRSGEATLARAVTQAYLEVLRQEEEVRLTRRQLERAEANLRLAEGQRAVGIGTDLDVSRARVEVGRSRVALLRAENGVHTARLSLYRQLGVEPPPDGPVTLSTEFELTEPRWTEQQLYDEALDRNPELGALRASRRAADQQVRAARSTYFPSLTIRAGLGGFTREPSSSAIFVEQARQQVRQQLEQCQLMNELFMRLADPLPTRDCSRLQLTDEDVRRIRRQNETFPFDFTDQPAQASLSVSIPLFRGFSRQRDLESARVERQDLRYQVREQELALRADIGSGLAAVRTAYETARIEEENQRVADEQLRLAREQYRLGQISFTELVEAETVKAQADRERLSALFSYHDALANLEAVVGRPLRNEGDDR